MKKVRTFPLLPKSNAYLEPGDYFAIPLPADKWACGRVLGRGPTGRSTFIGTVMDWCGTDRPTCQDIEGVEFADRLCHHHIKTITRFGMQIDGNCPIDQGDLPVTLVHSKMMMRGGLPTGEPIDVSAPRMPAASNDALILFAVQKFGGLADGESAMAYVRALETVT